MVKSDDEVISVSAWLACALMEYREREGLIRSDLSYRNSMVCKHDLNMVEPVTESCCCA